MVTNSKKSETTQIFLTGASGRLGEEVLKRIPNAIPLVRSPHGLKNEIVTSFEAKELREVLKNAKCVIHLAGSMNFLDPGELQAANVDLTKKIVDALPPKTRIIFASSISVYGKLIQVIPANEDTPLNPDSAYAKTKVDSEELVKKCSDYLILRVATIYGKDYEDYYTILKQIKKGSMYIIGHGQNHVPFVHVEDVADAIKNSLKAEKGVYVISGEAVKQEEVLNISADLLGVPRVTQHAPLDMALMFAGFEENKAMLMKQKPKITTEHVLILASDRVFDCSKAKKELKFNPRPLRDGIEEIVKEGRKNSLF